MIPNRKADFAGNRADRRPTWRTFHDFKPQPGKCKKARSAVLLEFQRRIVANFYFMQIFRALRYLNDVRDSDDNRHAVIVLLFGWENECHNRWNV